MKSVLYLSILFMLLNFAKTGKSQNSSMVHELYPVVGIYAADRFQTSFTGGIRYDYHFDRRFSLGASIGFAKAGQDYFQKVGLAAPEQGSSSVIYYNGRVTQAFPIGSVTPYGVIGLGVTKQHSESNFTVTVGIGTKIPLGKKIYLRYEFSDHIFSSGQNNTAWTNNNLEFSTGISFYLQ